MCDNRKQRKVRLILSKKIKESFTEEIAFELDFERIGSLPSGVRTSSGRRNIYIKYSIKVH